MPKKSINRYDSTIPEFSTRLEEAIELKGMTKKQLSRKLGLDDGTVCAYTTDRILPSILVLRDLCRILDVSADYLLELKETNN